MDVHPATEPPSLNGKCARRWPGRRRPRGRAAARSRQCIRIKHVLRLWRTGHDAPESFAVRWPRRRASVCSFNDSASVRAFAHLRRCGRCVRTSCRKAAATAARRRRTAACRYAHRVVRALQRDECPLRELGEGALPQVGEVRLDVGSGACARGARVLGRGVHFLMRRRRAGRRELDLVFS